MIHPRHHETPMNWILLGTKKGTTRINWCGGISITDPFPSLRSSSSSSPKPSFIYHTWRMVCVRRFVLCSYKAKIPLVTRGAERIVPINPCLKQSSYTHCDIELTLRPRLLMQKITNQTSKINYMELKMLINPEDLESSLFEQETY